MNTKALFFFVALLLGRMLPAAELPESEPLPPEWITEYGDPLLTSLVKTALANSPDLASAVARHEEALAGLRVARSAYFPQLAADGSWTRGRNPVTTGDATTETTAFAGGISWEIDLAGRTRHLSRSALAAAKASAADVDGAKLRLVTDTAATYFALIATEREAHAIEEGISLRQRALDIIGNRLRAGAATELDRARTEAELASSEADLAEIARRRAQLRHTLAALIGVQVFVPDAWPEALPSQLPVLPSSPTSLPSDLLLRRPDVYAANQDLISATERISVAKADFFPRLELLGRAGYVSGDINGLTDWGNRVWSIGPSLYLPIFQGGRNRAQLARASAQAAQADASLKATTLNAVREVADALNTVKTLQAQIAAQRRVVEASKKAATLSLRRYEAGAVSFLDVIDAERTRLAAERAAVQLEGQQHIAHADLVKALGGGWLAPEPMDGRVVAQR